MKTRRTSSRGPRVLSTLILSIAAAAAVLAATAPTRADIFVANYGSSTIGQYTDSGATVNASLITGLGGIGTPFNGPSGIAVSRDGVNLFVANFDMGTVGQYTTAGATVNATLIAGLNGPSDIAVSGTSLFVAKS